MSDELRDRVRAALVEGWHRCPETAPSTLDGMTDAVMELMADQDHRVLWEGETEIIPTTFGNRQMASRLRIDHLSARPGTVVVVVSRDNQNDATEAEHG